MEVDVFVVVQRVVAREDIGKAQGLGDLTSRDESGRKDGTNAASPVCEGDGLRAGLPVSIYGGHISGNYMWEGGLDEPQVQNGCHAACRAADASANMVGAAGETGRGDEGLVVAGTWWLLEDCTTSSICSKDGLSLFSEMASKCELGSVPVEDGSAEVVGARVALAGERRLRTGRSLMGGVGSEEERRWYVLTGSGDRGGREAWADEEIEDGVSELRIRKECVLTLVGT